MAAAVLISGTFLLVEILDFGRKKDLFRMKKLAERIGREVE